MNRLTNRIAVKMILPPLLALCVGFNFLEFLDFLLGWFGADILRDDDAGTAQEKARAR